jgi:tetratricopeptide (TPR) repeat protein
MPLGVDPSPSSPPPSDPLADLHSILLQHDLDRLEAFERTMEGLPYDAARLALSRAIAGYEDQRGWRAKAQARYTDLLRLYNADPHGRARILLDLAEMGMRWTDLPQMQRSLEGAREVLARYPDGELDAYLLRGEALLACLQHDLPGAKMRMQQALDGFQHLGAWPGIALGLNGMSYVCLNTRRWEEAVGYSRQGLQGDQAELNLRLRGDLLSNHGFALRRLRGNRVALPWVEDAYALRLDQRDPLLASRTGVNLAEIQRALGQLKEAEAVLQRGLGELRGIRMEDQAGSVANTLGALRFTQGDYAGAAAAYEEALCCAQALGQTRLEGIICANQAEVFYQWGDFRTASDWYARCAEVNAGQGDLSKAVDSWLQAARLITWVDPREISPILGRAKERVAQSPADDPDTAELAGQINREIELLSDITLSRPELRIQPRPFRLESLPPLPDPAQIATVDDDLVRLVNEILAVSPAPWELDRFSERFQAVMDAGRLASPATRDAAQAHLATGIAVVQPRAPKSPQVGGLRPGTDVEFSSYLALICGSLAEAGANPAPAIAPLKAAFERALPLALVFKSACGADMEKILSHPDPKALHDRATALDVYAARLPTAARAWNSLHGYCMGAVALLSRSPEGRRQFRADYRQREQFASLVSDCPELALLEELLSAPDGEELLVIHPGLKRGYRVRVSGITGNFQLHTLLAYLLIGDPQGGWLPGVRPNRRIMAAERGTLVPWENLIAQSIFNMVSWRGVQPDGSLSADPGTWIWGEGRPSDIPRFEGQWTILMGPLTYQDSWTARPKFPGLQAECILEEILSQPEVERILGRMIKARMKDEG